MLTEILQFLQESLQFVLGILGYSPHQEIVGDLVYATDHMPIVEMQEAWVVSAIAAAASIAGSIMKSRSAHKAAEQEQADLNKQRAENAALYNRRYYEDGTQRADVRRVLTEANNRLQRQNQAAAGANAVMGGTNAQAAAQKEASNEAYADMVSRAASAAESRKDAVEDRYVNADSNIHTQQRAITNQRSQAQQAAINDATGQVAQIASSYEAANAKKV